MIKILAVIGALALGFVLLLLGVVCLDASRARAYKRRDRLEKALEPFL